jgi:hypothetical protein
MPDRCVVDPISTWIAENAVIRVVRSFVARRQIQRVAEELALPSSPALTWKVTRERRPESNFRSQLWKPFRVVLLNWSKLEMHESKSGRRPCVKVALARCTPRLADPVALAPLTRVHRDRRLGVAADVEIRRGDGGRIGDL